MRLAKRTQFHQLPLLLLNSIYYVLLRPYCGVIPCDQLDRKFRQMQVLPLQAPRTRSKCHSGNESIALF